MNKFPRRIFSQFADSWLLFQLGRTALMKASSMASSSVVEAILNGDLSASEELVRAKDKASYDTSDTRREHTKIGD
jgi:hypothetical protein